MDQRDSRTSSEVQLAQAGFDPVNDIHVYDIPPNDPNEPEAPVADIPNPGGPVDPESPEMEVGIEYNVGPFRGGGGLKFGEDGVTPTRGGAFGGEYGGVSFGQEGRIDQGGKFGVDFNSPFGGLTRTEDDTTFKVGGETPTGPIAGGVEGSVTIPDDPTKAPGFGFGVSGRVGYPGVLSASGKVEFSSPDQDESSDKTADEQRARSRDYQDRGFSKDAADEMAATKGDEANAHKTADDLASESLGVDDDDFTKSTEDRKTSNRDDGESSAESRADRDDRDDGFGGGDSDHGRSY